MAVNIIFVLVFDFVDWCKRKLAQSFWTGYFFSFPEPISNILTFLLFRTHHANDITF